jgi:Haem-binding domain|tara:strand:+ start:781 stop:1242 length:462 start_codon:yes stop_codon:yes gene_type:complete
MKVLKIIALVLLIGFVGIQFVPTELNQSETVPRTDFMLVNQVPKDIRDKMQVSCYDCHSNNTQYPWYNKIQPIAWFLEDHIKAGKEELNFNTWGDYSARRKKSKLKSIASQIEDNKMPLNSYILIHGEATFSKVEKERILGWVNKKTEGLNNK